MTEKRLGHKQTAAMLALLAIAREVSNPELREIVGFAIDGQIRQELNKAGLVDSRMVKRSYTHELTDKGRAWCGKELAAGTPPPPPARSTLVTGLYVFLSGLNDYLQRENVRLADIFTPATEITPAEIESRIRKAYRKLAQSPRDWVGLVDLRPLLGEAPSDEVDAVLKQLSRTGQVHLVPEPNRKVLTAADHAAAIRVGGEDNHLISIEAS